MQGMTNPPSKRIRTGAAPGPGELESLKVAYLAAIDGESSVEICNDLHSRIMEAREANRGITNGWQSTGFPHPQPSLAITAGAPPAASSIRVFIAGLPLECSEAELKALVGQVATSSPLAECKVLPGKGCGYVIYSSAQAAQEAIYALNDRAVAGWPDPLRVWLEIPDGSGQPPPSQLRLGDVGAGGVAAICDAFHAKAFPPAGAGFAPAGLPQAPAAAQGSPYRLVVSGLPASCTDDELKALVDQVPFNLRPELCQIIECRMTPGRGSGVVLYSSFEAAQEAIDALNERAVAGWPEPLKVWWETPEALGLESVEVRERKQKEQKELEQQLQTQAAQLAVLLQQTQQQAHPAVLTQSSLPNSADTGLGDLQTLLGVSQVQAQLPSPLNMQPATAEEEAAIRSQGLDPCRLFIGQIRREFIDERVLAALFDPFGQVMYFRFMTEKGVAFVQYSSFTAAKNAVHYLNNKEIQGISSKVGLNVKYSTVRG